MATRQEAIMKGDLAVRLSLIGIHVPTAIRGAIFELGLSRIRDQKESIPRQDLLVLCKKFNLIIAHWCAGRVVARAHE